MSALELGVTFSSGLTRLWDALRRPWAVAAVRVPRIRVAGRAVLTPTHSVHVVEMEGRRWVLGCHPNGFLVLSPDPEPDQEQAK
jgi:Flagellar biosynthesis protein, FliO